MGKNKKQSLFWAPGAGATGLCQQTADFEQWATEPAVTSGEVTWQHLLQGRQRCALQQALERGQTPTKSTANGKYALRWGIKFHFQYLTTKDFSLIYNKNSNYSLSTFSKNLESCLSHCLTSTFASSFLTFCTYILTFTVSSLLLMSLFTLMRFLSVVDTLFLFIRLS